jgi:S1-C subfamily serine protease
MTHKARFTVFGAVMAAACLSAGCGATPASVDGTVAVDGKPLTAGQVSFVPTTGNAVSAEIGPDGSYHVDGLPPGDVIVLVAGPPPPVTGNEGLRSKLSTAGPPAAAAPAGPEVPKRYQSVATSDLTRTLQPGPNDYPIDLRR